MDIMPLIYGYIYIYVGGGPPQTRVTDRDSVGQDSLRIVDRGPSADPRVNSIQNTYTNTVVCTQGRPPCEGQLIPPPVTGV